MPSIIKNPKKVYSLSASTSGSTVVTNDLDPAIAQQNTPPVSPTVGDRYLVGTAPTGAWIGKAKNVAEWDGASWIFTAPTTDDIIFLSSTAQTLRYNGSLWVAWAGTPLLHNGNTLSTSLVAGTNNAQAFILKTNNVERARFSATGDFGIGIISPAYKLDVSSASSSAFRVSTVSTFNDAIIQSDQYSASLSINASTGVPIGGYNAGLYLNSLGVKRGSFNSESTTSVTTLESAGGYWLLLKNGTAESIGLGQGGNYIQFGTNGTTKMLIEGSTGNIGINELSPLTKLDVNGSMRVYNGGTRIGNVGIGAYSFWTNLVNEISTNFNNTTQHLLLQYSEGGNVSIGANTSPARLYIKGIDATSSNYSLKVDNSSSSPLLYVRNDGYTGVNLSTFSYRFQVGNDIDGNGIALSTTANQPLVFLGKNTVGIPTGYLGIFDSNGVSKVAISCNQYCVGDFINTGLNFGIGANFSPSVGASAKLHVVGIDSTSSNYALKIDNSASTPLLYIRNDGHINIATLPTSNIGLSTGDLYVDTAANILANGDKVVGWKV